MARMIQPEAPPAPIDPETAADELLRMFASQAEEIVDQHINWLLSLGNIKELRLWYTVKMSLREKMRDQVCALETVH